MAEDQDKSQQTEEPTAKRLEQARENGDVVKSTEVTTFILLGGGTLAIAMFGKYTALGLAHALSLFIEQPDTMSVDGAGLAAMMRALLPQVALALGPFFARDDRGRSSPAMCCKAAPAFPSTRSCRISPRSRPWPASSACSAPKAG